MSDIAIQVENISKRYQLGGIGAGTLRETLVNGWERLRGREGSVNGDANEFWALKDINFEVKQGEVVGIIGKNGAGKSTLLKVLSRITEPTTGQIMLNGRIASLLEVGTGFHPELTGRENIFLNGSILGMTRAEIKRKFDEIVDFSGVEKFLDTPVKRYSSGMYVRLAFAVAAHLDPEILVIDEVLAVGDVEFQKKCLGKMQDVAVQGKTVLFVSHNMGAVRKLCSRAILLNQGTVETDGEVANTIAAYIKTPTTLTNKRNKSLITWNPEDNPGKDELRLVEVGLTDAKGEYRDRFSSSEPIYISVLYELLDELRNMRVIFQILTHDDQILFATTSHSSEQLAKSSGTYFAKIEIPPNLLNSQFYKVLLHIGCPGVKILVDRLLVTSFEVEKDSNLNSTVKSSMSGFIAPNIDWEIGEQVFRDLLGENS